MNFYLNLFSVETWEAFRQHGAGVSGFSRHRKTQASNVEAGSIFLCYLVKLSRWVGALRIDSTSFEESTPIFKAQDDPFTTRFKVSPIVLLNPDDGIPIQQDVVWERLEWTKDIKKGSVGWGANFQRSLRQIPDADGEFLSTLLKGQLNNPVAYPLSPKDKRILYSQTKIKTETGEIEVEIPDDDDESTIEPANVEPLRESLEIQAKLATIGAAMGFKIWLPRNDRTRLIDHLRQEVQDVLLDELPLSFGDVVMQTIENIDVLWMEKRSIIRAFEVEHTTAIYSGLLRMADLVSLVPNIDVKLHIVAADERREKVFKEIKRPVFQIMEGQFGRRCTFISYASVNEISDMKQLEFLKDAIVDEYAEQRDY